MLSIEGILGFLNDKERKLRPFIYKWRDVYFRMSLHIDGICPVFDANVNGNVVKVYPSLYYNYYDATYQYIFDAYLFNRYAREPQLTRNWRYSVYKPLTQDPFQRAIQSITGALFQDSGFQVTIADQSDNEYIWGENFEGKDLVSYFASNFQNICNDPNGMFFIIPKEPYYATTSKEIEPKIVYVKSRYIEHFTDDEVMFECDDCMWVINKIGYFRFKKDEQGNYYNLDGANGGYYSHLLNRIPVLIAGGIWNSQGYYESWLKAARPYADEYAIEHSDLQMVMKQASFPFLTFAASECPDCDHGKIQVCGSCHYESCRCGGDTDSSNLELVNCGKCGGSGSISINPGDVLVAQPDDMKNPLVRVETISTDINKLHIERVDSLMKNIEASLHLSYIDQAQSGVAKDKDMETRYQFYLKIANDMFDRLIRGAIRHIISLRNVTTVNGVATPLTGNIDELYTIVKPTEFGIYTSFDLNEEYKMSRDSGLPNYILTEILGDYTDKRFGGNDVLKRKTMLLGELDMFNSMSYADISVALLNNGGTDRDLQYHLKLPLILDELARERGDEWFINAPFDTIKQAADTKFNAMKPVIPTTQPELIERVDV